MMRNIRSFTWSVVLGAAIAAGITTMDAQAAADDSKKASPEKERELIAVLQSGAPPQDKAIACKKLAIYGSREAVPALATLLENADLSSWARIALEAIPGPAADDALRAALGKTQGRLLVGVINSIGFRRDPKAVSGLTGKLADADADVVAAAGAALGRIGGDAAAKALTSALATAPSAARLEVADGCVVCADGFLADKKTDKAIRLYEAVRKAQVPKQQVLEATRGLILARGAAGLPLLLEQLRSPDKAFLAIALRTARELPGREVTKALASEVERATPERQVALLQVLGDRADTAVLGTVSQAARTGPAPVRLAAIDALERFNSAACVPVLLEVAAGEDARVARASKTALSRLSGKEVDATLLASLSKSEGKTRPVLIELAGQRRIEGAMPQIVRFAEDSDPAVRRAAVATVGSLGEDAQAGDLVRMLQKTQNANERGDLENALLALSSRQGAGCLPQVMPLTKSSDSGLRQVGLRALSGIGGAAALAVVKAAVEDQNEAVQDEAVRTLSTWPNNWPEDAGVAEPLLALAKSGKTPAYRVQGMRGYLLYLQEDKKLKDTEKLDGVNTLLPLINRPEEKRLAVSVLGTIPTAAALELLANLAADQTVAEEVYLAMTSLAGKRDLKNASKELRERSLRTVVEKSKSDRTKNRAEEALKKL